MSRIRSHKAHTEAADLDITAFMNLMIVLVPVLLLGMVFSQIAVLDLKLPEASGSETSDGQAWKKEIELIIRDDSLSVNYPQGILLKHIPKIPADTAAADTANGTALTHDFKLLSLVLQEIKRQLREKGIEQKSITLLSEPDTDYQTIVSAMDTVRSYKAVVAASVVDAELFPQVMFGDAPALDKSTMAMKGGKP